MKLTFETQGATAAVLGEKIHRRMSEFAGDLPWRIVEISVDEQIKTSGGETLYDIARVEAWVEDPA